MTPKTFVFIGRSGCGKGTQAKLLMDALKEKDPESEIFYLETGQQFRDFIATPGYTNELSQAIYKTGAPQPGFLAIWTWSRLLVDKLKPEQHLFVDGTPRALPEAVIFLDAMKFYNRQPTVIYLNVSRTWSEARLLGRAREDDKSADEVKRRLDWFDHSIAPAVEFLKNSPDVSFFDVNGERTIEEIHTDLVGRLTL